METISFAGDAPSADLLPLGELADCAEAALRRDGKTILSYGSGAGYTPLRELIGEWFGVHPYRVVLTNGWLQGFTLLIRGFVQGRTVAVEHPTFEPALHALLGSGAALISIAVDDQGMNTHDLEQQLIQYTRPALVYVTPSFQNPSGATMPEERRRHLARIVAEQNRLQVDDILIVEDESNALTRFEGDPVPAVFDLSGKQTIYSSSFSSTVAPGLRVGWLILPEELAGQVTETAASTIISPSLLAQATVFELLARGGFESHLTLLRSGLRERRDAMLAAFERHFPDATWTRPSGGTCLLLRLAPGVDGRRVIAAADGITALPGTAFGATSNVLRLCYGSVTPDEIDTGVAGLAGALACYLDERDLERV